MPQYVHCSRRTIFSRAMLIVLLAALVAIPVAPARAAIVRFVAKTGVNIGDCSLIACLTITYAIGQALAGDTLNIAAGVYVENLSLSKNLTLNGAGAASTILDGGAI